MKIKFKKLCAEAVLPVKATPHAACFDFTVTRIERVGYNKYTLFFGLSVEIPHGTVLTLQPRSSFTHTSWVMGNTPGQIDSDFRGELRVKLEAIPVEVSEEVLYYPELPFKVGDRCAQGKLEMVVPYEIEEVEELSTTERGVNGFGSTGK